MENTIMSFQQDNSTSFSSAGFAVNVYTGEDVLNQISNGDWADEWHSLYETCAWATVYQSMEFVSNWYRVYQHVHTPVLIVAIEKGVLKGVLALCETKGKKMVGAGMNQAEYQTWISSELDSQRFINEAMTALWKQYPGHTLHLKFLPQETPISWTDTDPIWRKSCWLQSFGHPIMNIDREWLETELRKKNRREKINRLKRLGELKLDRITSYADFCAVFDGLSVQNDFRKAAVYNADNLINENLSREFLLSLFKDGLLHATVLKVGNEIIAANVGTMGKKWVHLQGMNAHAPRYARHSPGILHFFMMGQLLAEEGFEIFDLTPGADSYKNMLATDFKTAYQLTVSKPSTILLRRGVFYMTQQLKSILLKTGMDAQSQRRNKKSLNVLSEKLKLVKREGISPLWHHVTVKAYKNTVPWYKINIDQAEAASLNLTISTHSLSDILKYEPKGTLLTRWEFLEDAMKRLENGQQPYSVVDETRLLLLVWNEKQQRKKASSEKKSFPPGEAGKLIDLYVHPVGESLVKEFLEGVAKMVVQENDNTFLSTFINANNTAVESLIRKSGFIRVPS